MTNVRGKNFEHIKNIIESNNIIKKSTLATVGEFLTLQKDFIEKIHTAYDRLRTVKDVANIFLDDEKQKFLEGFKPIENVQLAVCGYNSSGKTSFLHEFLECGKFLPAGIGATSARIVKFSYQNENEACLKIYKSVIDTTEIVEKRISLSPYFADFHKTQKSDTKGLKNAVKEELTRPNYDENLPAFEEWASFFIEICIPSPVLALGINVYDTPGFLAADPPVLSRNLLALVASMRPSLLFLYDNSTVPDDSRKCFDQLKFTLGRHFQSTGIFFLNSKADVETILNDNEDDEDQNQLLHNERLRRYDLLLKVNEVRSDLLHDNDGSLENCDCFDIFTVLQGTHQMAKTMKSNAIDRIISFAAKYDLKGAQQVSDIILAVIDVYFDFVLITNRRSEDEWKKLKEKALDWGEKFFEQFSLNIDKIADEAKQHLPIKFRALRSNIEERAIVNCKKRWWTKNDVIWYAALPLLASYNESRKIAGNDAPNEDIQSVNLIIENDVLKPVLREIVNKTQENIRIVINQNFLLKESSKNELLNAAFRELIVQAGDISTFAYHYSVENILCKVSNILITMFILPITTAAWIGMTPLLLPMVIYRNMKHERYSESDLQHRQQGVQKYLQDIEKRLSDMHEEIKKNLNEWHNKQKQVFKITVNSYHQLVKTTINHRQQAYELARTFAPKFARIECRLVANLDLSAHNGILPIIENETIGSGGFFTIHPASWNIHQSLVAKVLRDPIGYRNFDYMEAHFHRTITRLNIDHIVPLSYLFEETGGSSKLMILLPRYKTNLHTYLMNNIQKITLEKAVQISLDIARAVLEMHNYEVVHRDIKVSNILLDDNDQVFLADFGTCQHGTENTTIIGSRPLAPELNTTASSSSEHQFSYEGSAVDVFSLGVLMYVVSPKITYNLPNKITKDHVNALDQNQIPQSYRDLIIHCIDDDSKRRPNSKEVVTKLETIMNQVANQKTCLVCLENPRYARCFPCQHKTMCRRCLTNVQQTNPHPICILCRKIIINIEEDTDVNTFSGISVSNH